MCCVIVWLLADCLASFLNDGVQGPDGPLEKRIDNAKLKISSVVNLRPFVARYGYIPPGLISIVATEPIAKGSQITINYSDGYWKDEDASDGSLSTYDMMDSEVQAVYQEPATQPAEPSTQSPTKRRKLRKQSN